jgi:membrane protein YqaA with SNARE-associated domain
MSRFVAQIQSVALAMGAPGLFLVAFLDSSFLSLPEIADLMVIWMVTQRKALFVWYAVSATIGSLAGCLILYFLGRKGGDALVRKRFSGASVDRALATFRRYGVAALLIPSILPPPAPFKIFILLAGVANITTTRFTIAIAIGRGARYFAEALLAVWYGDRAMAFVHEHARAVSLAVAGLLLIGLAAYVVWTKARTPAKP